jgi:hypothetical protein
MSVCATAMAGTIWWVMPALFDLDDAYIIAHSAQVVHSGVDPVFGQPALTGVTSPAYLALVAAIVSSGADALFALRLAGALGICSIIVSLWYLGRALDLGPIHTAVVVVVTMTSGMVLRQATNGLETGWAIGLAIALIAASRRGAWLPAAVLAGLLPWVRPDAAPVALVAFAYALREHSWAVRRRATLLAACAALPCLLWVHADTGRWLPQTMQAKQFFFAQGCWPAIQKGSLVIGAVCQWLVFAFPLSIGVVGWRRDPQARWGIVAIVSCLGAYWWAFPGALFHNDFRYAYAILTPWCVLGMGVLLQSARRAGLLVVSVLVVIMQVISPLPARLVARMPAELLASAQWIDQHTPADATILIHDAGAMSVFAHRRLVDFVGLKTPQSIDTMRVSWASCGARRGEGIAAIARASGASYLVVVSDWEQDFGIAEELRGRGARLATLREPPAGQRGYTIYSMTF